MKKYTVKQPFMARAGQFQPQSTLCIGIECTALKGEPYRCYIGKNKDKYYDIDYEKAMDVVSKHGERNVIWTVRGKKVFILPLMYFKHGEHSKDLEPKQMDLI